MGKISSFNSFYNKTSKCYKRDDYKKSAFWKASSGVNTKNNFSNLKRNKSSYKNSNIKMIVVLKHDHFNMIKRIGKKFNSIIINFRGENVSKEDIESIKFFLKSNNSYSFAYVNFYKEIDSDSYEVITNVIRRYFLMVYIFDARNKTAKKYIKTLKQLK